MGTAEPGSATGTRGSFFVFQTGSGQEDKFVCAVLLVKTVQALALANNLPLADRDGRVFPGLAGASTRKLAESWLEVINRMGKHCVEVAWSDVVETAHVKKLVLPKMRRTCVVAESDGSLASTEVDRGAKCAHHDLKKFKEDRHPSVSDTVGRLGAVHLSVGWMLKIWLR